MVKKSELEEKLLFHMRVSDLPTPIRNYKFHSKRRWMFDFAWPDYHLAVEVEGGIWLDGGGRHNRPIGFIKDCEKYNTATMDGWSVLRVTSDHINSGKALEWIKTFIDHYSAVKDFWDKNHELSKQFK